MRYYSLILKANSDQIQKETVSDIRLRDYCYDSAIGAVNAYVYKNIENNVGFYMYHEEEDKIYAVFSYDEKKISYRDAYDCLTETLREKFNIKKVLSEPDEITMYQALDYYKEGRRRDYMIPGTKLIDNVNLWLYYVDLKDEIRSLRYQFDEEIIADKPGKKHAIYDKSFLKEMSNIESHTNSSEIRGNMVQYIISARSIDAARDMTAELAQKLLKANRLTSRRMEIISKIDPDLYKGSNNHIEEIIENNYGGVVIFDLLEKFGKDPVEYLLTSKYIEGLFKKYRNKCLFVFTYNMDQPGFSYQLLPNIQKYAIPVMLREGKGDRKAAVKYMESLIKDSELAKYSGQAAEFMKLFPGDEFSQTDVLEAYEKFDSWCINKNIMKAYDFDINGDFMLDRDENDEPAYDQLQKMIGLESVKRQIDNILANNIVDRERRKRKGKGYRSGSMHMCFMGNPGAGKTEVAKYFAKIAKEYGILKSGACVFRGGTDLCGLGGIAAIREAFIAAKDGVLFIDEAYALGGEGAITTLVQELEDKRDEVIVILAGYSDRMKAWLENNEGLKSRIPYFVDFPDYTASELTDIFKLMLKQQGFSATKEAINKAYYIFDKARYIDDFGNGRYVRNLLKNAIKNQAVRINSNGSDLSKLKDDEMFLITEEDITHLDDGLREERPAGTAQKELDEMIGLANVKKVLHKAIANFKLNKLCMDRGIQREKVALHLAFTGNPGTAKTTCARLLAEILRDERVLPTGNYVEASRADLIGPVVGTTAILVKNKFRQAKGGVLFIDEAYSLVDSHENSFGDEAIAQIVLEMENNRDNTIVIFGGYTDKMKAFLDKNPGMRSRVAFQVQFDDYSVDEMCDITKLIVSQNHMTITDAAVDKLRKIYEDRQGDPNFGNGRGVRKLVEEAEMNLAERLSGMDAQILTTELITTIEECDVPDAVADTSSKERIIGFAC